MYACVTLSNNTTVLCRKFESLNDEDFKRWASTYLSEHVTVILLQDDDHIESHIDKNPNLTVELV